MKCACSSNEKFEGNDATAFEQVCLREIQVDAVNWKTLYKCKECDEYWEETYLDGRFGGIPELRKVDESYVSSVWGPEQGRK